MVDRSKFDEVIAELEADAFERGREQGINEGVTGERKRLANILRLLTEITAELDKMQRIGEADQAAQKIEEKKPPREGTDQHRVLEDIRSNPGSRGVDIVNRLPDIEERTVRTALFRLKKKNLIFSDNGAWMPLPVLQQQEGQPR